MPYKSKAQQGYFHANPEKVGGEKVVKEFDQATKGKYGSLKNSFYGNRRAKKNAGPN